MAVHWPSGRTAVLDDRSPSLSKLKSWLADLAGAERHFNTQKDWLIFDGHAVGVASFECAERGCALPCPKVARSLLRCDNLCQAVVHTGLTTVDGVVLYGTSSLLLRKYRAAVMVCTQVRYVCGFAE